MLSRISIARSRGFKFLMLGLALIAAAPETGAAQETKAGTAAAERPATERSTTERSTARRTRLPAYYGRVATVDQRAALDKIQANYAVKIEKLREELDKLLAARDAELRAALGAEQQKQFDELVAAARERRRSRSTRNASATTSGSDAAATARPVKPTERTTAKP